MLNYRVHEVQHVNPAGKDWEHVVESETGGANSVGNMALAASNLNNNLAAYYKTRRVYPELALEDVVEAMILREHMCGKATPTSELGSARSMPETSACR